MASPALRMCALLQEKSMKFFVAKGRWSVISLTETVQEVGSGVDNENRVWSALRR